jgi:hypothetical protein
MLTDIANTVQCGTANFNFTWPRYNITYTGRSAFTAAAGGDCAVTFGIRLNSQFCTLTGCKVELKLTGGIIKTTGPILGAILKPGDNNFTFNFRAAITGSPITFTVVVSDQFGNQIFTFNDSTATAMSLTAAAGTTVTRSGDTLTISFKASFSNPCCPLQGCAIVLNGTGGVTAPAPLTNVTLANGLNTFNFVFNTSIANKVDIIATLAVYDNQLNLLGTLAYDLKPVLLVTMNWQVGASGPGHPCGSCTGASDTDAGFDIKNIGLGPTVALKLPGVVCGCFGNLGVGINWPSPQGQPLVIGILLPGATIQAGNFAHVARFSGHGPFTITFLDGTYNFPNFITPVTP